VGINWNCIKLMFDTRKWNKTGTGY